MAATLAIMASFAVVPGAAFARHNPRPIFWGALIGRQFTGTQAPWDMRAAHEFARSVHKAPSLISFYIPFADCSVSPCSFYSFPTIPMESVRRYGAIPFLSWSSGSTSASVIDQPTFRLSRIIDGTYDSHIREFAEAARAWGHPFFLRFDWEMNGFWFPWNEGVNGNRPGEFVTAWRHVHEIFTSAGATNATWVWCPNIALISRLQHLRSVYPGNAYVDWTCLDGFNWGDTANSAGWTSFDRIFNSTYRRVLHIAPNKPMVIAETGSEERGGSKADWIRHTLRVIPTRYPQIRGLIWFNEVSQGMRWPIESSRAARRTFAAGIQRKVYRPNLYASLPDGPIRPPSW